MEVDVRDIFTYAAEQQVKGSSGTAEMKQKLWDTVQYLVRNDKEVGNAVLMAVLDNDASVSALRKHFKIGHNRCAFICAPCTPFNDVH